MYFYLCFSFYYFFVFFFFNDTATTEIYTLSLHDALPLSTGTRFVMVSPSESRSTFNHPRYRRPFAIAKRFSVTFTAEMPPRRSPREPSGFTSLMPTVSLTTVQAVPAGIDPIGSPFASSVMNSSPSPPNVTLGAPATSPIRSSGSAPGVRGEGCGRRHAPARARALATPRLAQRRVELCDGGVDVGIGMRAGDESCLERRRREEHAARQRGPVPAREQARVRGLGLGEVPDRAGREVHPPHRAGVPRGDGDPVSARGVPYTRDQPRGSPLERLVEPRSLRLAQRGEARCHGHRISRERASLIDRSLGRDQPHEIRAPAVRPHRHPPADDLAECREVGSHVEPFLRPSGRDPE